MAQKISARRRLYYTWHDMNKRCHNPKARDYGRYGAKGIEVCARWRNSFDAFLADIGYRPSDDHSIDRIDPSGNYCPENCRWATRKQQANNACSNRIIEFCGQRKTMSEWAAKRGISAQRIHQRLKAGWSVERALTTLVQSRPGGPA